MPKKGGEVNLGEGDCRPRMNPTLFGTGTQPFGKRVRLHSPRAEGTSSTTAGPLAILGVTWTVTCCCLRRWGV